MQQSLSPIIKMEDTRNMAKFYCQPDTIEKIKFGNTHVTLIIRLNMLLSADQNVAAVEASNGVQPDHST